MSLSVTKTSGSVEEYEADAAVPVEDGNDLLRECAGKCGKKILFFGFLDSSDWGEGVEGALCVECRSKPLKHIPEVK
jgi:fermentation-respiration switch protein FrsA (DUF1100 family)